MKQRFLDPYAGFTPEELLRTTVSIGLHDVAFLRSLHARPSALQITIYVLLTKLINELKRNNITSYDPARFERAVAGCTFVLPGDVLDAYGQPATSVASGPNALSAPKTVDRNDQRGTTSVARAPVAVPVEPSANAVAAPRAGKRRGVKKADAEYR